MAVYRGCAHEDSTSAGAARLQKIGIDLFFKKAAFERLFSWIRFIALVARRSREGGQDSVIESEFVPVPA